MIMLILIFIKKIKISKEIEIKQKKKIPFIRLEEVSIKEEETMWCSHCHSVDNNELKSLLVGDSHIEQWIPAIYNILNRKGISIHHYYLNPNKVSDKSFKDFHYQFFKNEYFEIVFVSFALRDSSLLNRKRFEDNFEVFISFLLTISKLIIIIDDIPFMQPPYVCHFCCIQQRCSSCYLSVGNNVTILPSFPRYINKRVIYLNMEKYFCKNGICKCKNKNTLVFEAGNHIYPAYIRSLTFAFEEIKELSNMKVNMNYNSSCQYYMHGELVYRSC